VHQKRVIDLHVQCDDKGVQVGVHLTSMVELGITTRITDVFVASDADPRSARNPWK
jgi:hypothetical protein